MARCLRNGNMMVEGGGGGGGVVAKATYALSRRIFDTMRCGSLSLRRSPSLVSIHRHTPKQCGNAEADDGQDLDWKELVERLRRGSMEDTQTTPKEQETSASVEEVTQVEKCHMDKKIRAFNEFQGVVHMLQFGDEGAKEEAAQDIRRLAKDDADARVTLAMLGAIPPLVAMLHSSVPDIQGSALFALLNLAIGNDLNKAAVVKAGGIEKMVKLLEGSNERIREVVVVNLLSLSALDVNKAVIGSSGAVPFLVGMMQHGGLQARKDALRALYNLSICHANAREILETGAAQLFVSMVGEMEMDVTEKVLATLSNLAGTEEGRKSIGKVEEAFTILIDVLNWNDAPKCQEKAAYILMIMAHNSWSHRQAMAEAGVVSSLLELTLFGTALAQKRASRILESIREDKNRRSSPISAPLTSQHTEIEATDHNNNSTSENEIHLSDERRIVKRLVQQSLHHNMQRIIKRANLPENFAPSDHLKSLTTTSSSKSLPF